MNILDIQFNDSSISTKSIEIIALDELYKRRYEMDHDPNKAHRVHFYLMIYIEEGEGTHFIDFKDYTFTKGSFIFVNKNQIQAFSLDSNIRGKAVLFTEAYIEQIQSNMNIAVFPQNYKNASHEPIFTPSDKLIESSTTLLTEIQKEMQHNESDNQIIMLLFSSLFMMLKRERTDFKTSKLSSSQVKQFHQFISLLVENFREQRDASFYAKALHISYKTLNNLCKLASNETVKQLIDSYIIIEAKRHLVLDDKQIQEIAYHFGFMEVSNFVKYFKKHTLLTPSQFKKQSKS